MPHIEELPYGAVANRTDYVPVAQGGITRALPLGLVLDLGKFVATTGALLGRFAGTNGDPQPIVVGSGLTLTAAGVLQLTPDAVPSAGTTAGTFAAGDDVRITGAVQATALAKVSTTGAYGDLSGLPTIPAVGNTAGTVAAGNDPRITGALTQTAAALIFQPISANLKDFDISVFRPGVGAGGTVLLLKRLYHLVVLAPGLAGCSADATAAAKAQTDYVLSYIRGTVTTAIVIFRFAAGATAATLVSATVPTLQNGDILTLVEPTTADATLANIGFTIFAQKV